MVKGIVASEGYAVGTAYVYAEPTIIIDRRKIELSETDAECERFADAVSEGKTQINQIRQKAGECLDESEANVFKAHLSIINDPSLRKKVNRKIENDRVTADNALEAVMNNLVATFARMDNPLIRERALDIKDVCTRLLCILTGTELRTLSGLDDQTIIVAKMLTPSDTIQMDYAKVCGLVVEEGGTTSHTAILARTLGIPAVVGVSGAAEELKTGTELFLDAVDGTVSEGLSGDEAADFRKKLDRYLQMKNELAGYADMESVTKDGRKIEVCANIGSYKDCEAAQKYGIEGVGLFRTEFLYMGKQNWPSEQEQFEEYRKVAELMGSRGVIVRTLDIGGDKGLPYFDFGEEDNPFLGWRAIRMCLDNRGVLKTQLRAILKASAYGKLRIMYPMITSIDEIRAANNILAEAKKELDQEGLGYDGNIEVGIMVETPAAAVIADRIIEYVDFFSIGTNDLTQYTTASDRGNKKIASLCDPYHPAVLRLIGNVIDVSHAAGKWTGMCGELAGDPRMTETLVGMGIDELSMSAGSVLKVRKALTEIDSVQSAEKAGKILAMSTAREIRDALTEGGQDGN